MIKISPKKVRTKMKVRKRIKMRRCTTSKQNKLKKNNLNLCMQQSKIKVKSKLANQIPTQKNRA